MFSCRSKMVLPGAQQSGSHACLTTGLKAVWWCRWEAGYPAACTLGVASEFLDARLLPGEGIMEMCIRTRLVLGCWDLVQT